MNWISLSLVVPANGLIGRICLTSEEGSSRLVAEVSHVLLGGAISSKLELLDDGEATVVRPGELMGDS
jgi:hypothetical protein